VTSLEEEDIKLERRNMRGKERNKKRVTKNTCGGHKLRIYLKY
jgi:hypothetical protein